ncbi:transcriptional regulator [Enterococcus florum]|uniref:Transcriptional regulator n=2 Tax=Enterococcus florum TaxID=2480627 RepID=A0A4P5PGS8_9ENTE|nr:transcriptional regulator [Enterococcus florum]
MYGEIIKQIRKAKGFTQKEVYTGVVSKTFYSDFEAGKYSVEIAKFEGLLKNLGITYQEFEYFRNQSQRNEAKALEEKIDQLYKSGKFEELYDSYQEYRQHQTIELRYLASQAYLLVLITNPNFYQFSRDPFNEIVAELENAKMWTLKEIKLSKLVLLSFSEKEKKKAAAIHQRILQELEKYQSFDGKVYYEEVGDLYFNRIQSLLVIHDIEAAQASFEQYQQLIQQSDNLHLLIQMKFSEHLLQLYLDFPIYQPKLKALLQQLSETPTSETRFYQIIFQIHQEKAKSYYERYRKK